MFPRDDVMIRHHRAYVLYRLIMTDPYVGVLNVISLFVMIGIGVDGQKKNSKKIQKIQKKYKKFLKVSQNEF